MAKKPVTDAPDGAPLAPPCSMVIFGAAGDLTKRLVVPALYNLVGAGRLPDEFRIVGVDLASKTTEEWRTGLTDTMQGFVGSDAEFAVDHIDRNAWQWLTDRMSYLQGDLTDAEMYRRLTRILPDSTRQQEPRATASSISRLRTASSVWRLRVSERRVRWRKETDNGVES